MKKQTLKLYAREGKDFFESNLNNNIFLKEEVIKFLEAIKLNGNLKDGWIKEYADATIQGEKQGLSPKTYNYYLKKHPDFEKIEIIDYNKHLTLTDDIILSSYINHAIKIRKTNNKKILTILAASTILMTGVLHQTGKLEEIKDKVVESIEARPIYENFENLTRGIRMLNIENRYRREQREPEIYIFGQEQITNYEEAKKFYALFDQMLKEHERPENIHLLWDMVQNGSEEELRALHTSEKKAILLDFYLQKDIYFQVKEIMQNEMIKGAK